MTATSKRSASAKIIEESNPEKTVTDALGRKITYRTLNVLDQFRLSIAMGAERSDNAAAMRLATVAAMVTAIDGVPYPHPGTYPQIEAALGRLGDEGLMALVLRADGDAKDLEEKTRDVPLDSPAD